MQVLDRTRFEDFPLMAKLTRWGVDFHMGILFGLVNQLLLIAFGLALCVLIIWGYRMWWMRRPAQSAANPVQTLCQSWLALIRMGKGRRCNQRTAGAGVAGDGRESGAVCSG
jgi:uncharacterized iron-regulated membrane protein